MLSAEAERSEIRPATKSPAPGQVAVAAAAAQLAHRHQVLGGLAPALAEDLVVVGPSGAS